VRFIFNRGTSVAAVQEQMRNSRQFVAAGALFATFVANRLEAGTNSFNDPVSGVVKCADCFRIPRKMR
jgi:hypothetical protein